jgi:hypothetical protein
MPKIWSATLRLVHNYDSDINDKQIIVNEVNVWGWKKTMILGILRMHFNLN